MQASEPVRIGRLCGIVVLSALLAAGCKKEKDIIQDVVYDNVLYDNGDQPLYTSSSQKVKQKSNAQYLSILHADLFQQSIPANELNEMDELFYSVGDKKMATELLISNYMNDPSVIMPTKADMLNDIDKFVTDTYVRFFVRNPSELEKYYFRNLIQNDTSFTPEQVYYAFATSNEYWFY